MIPGMSLISAKVSFLISKSLTSSIDLPKFLKDSLLIMYELLDGNFNFNLMSNAPLLIFLLIASLINRSSSLLISLGLIEISKNL